MARRLSAVLAVREALGAGGSEAKGEIGGLGGSDLKALSGGSSGAVTVKQ